MLSKANFELRDLKTLVTEWQKWQISILIGKTSNTCELQYLFEITVRGHIRSTTSEGQYCTALKMKCKPGKSYIRNSMETSHCPFEFVVIKSTYTSILFRKRTAATQKRERNKSPVWALAPSELLHHRNIPVLLCPVMAVSLCTFSLTLNPH